MTVQCGLFGYPLGHSISAVFQQAAFDLLGIAATYTPWEVPPDAFPARLQALRQASYLGANVTIPHKEAALGLVDEADVLARTVGAVNTVINRNGRLIGANTDVVGFLRSLRCDAAMDPAGCRAVLLGAGGAARGIAVALRLAAVSHLTISNRHSERAAALQVHLDAQPTAVWHELRDAVGMALAGSSTAGASTTVEVVPWDGDKLRLALASASLVIDATSLGMLGKRGPTTPLAPQTHLPADAVLVDVVANPLHTPLMRIAEQAGARALGGLPMLIYQGAASFTLWTGEEAPVDVMRRAACAHMSR